MKFQLCHLILSTTLIVASFHTISAQTHYESVKSEIESIKTSIKEVNSNNSKVKLKDTKFSSFDYTINAYFVKDDIVEGLPITILNKGKETLFEGKVLSNATPLSALGVYYESNGLQKVGEFVLSNSSDGSLIFKPRRAENIIVSSKSLSYVIGSNNHNPVIIDLRDKTLVGQNQNTRSGYKSLYSKISITDPNSIDIQKTLMSLSQNVIVEWDDRTFEGTVSPYISGNQVLFNYKSGTCIYKDGRKITVRQTNSMLEMSVAAPGAKDIKYSVPLSMISEDLWWSETEVAKQAEKYEQQKRAESEAKSSNKTNTNSTTSSSQSKQNIKDSESSASDSGSDSDDDDWILKVIIAVVILLLIRHELHKRDCPKCHKRHAMRDVDKQYMGASSAENVKQSDGRYKKVIHNKYKIIRECKYCGYQDFVEKEE